MDQVTVTRTMPNSLEAEQSVIGSMLMDKDAIIAAMESLQGEDFFHQSYGMLFDTIIEVYNAGEDAMDPVVLTNKLREKNAPAEISDVNFLLSLMEHVPSRLKVIPPASLPFMQRLRTWRQAPPSWPCIRDPSSSASCRREPRRRPSGI